MSLLAHIGRSGAKLLAPASARALSQSEQFRQYAATPAAPAAQDEDVVLSSFRQSQQQYQQLMQGLQNINLPLTGDDAAVKKYAADVEALKKQIGMPDVEDVITAELDYKYACANQDVRSFVSGALEGMSLGGGLEAAKGELLAAVDEAERSLGAQLGGANAKGWQVLTAKLGEIERKYGLSDQGKVRDDAIFDMYKKHITQLRTQVVDDMNKARTDDLADVPTNLAGLKPKLA